LSATSWEPGITTPVLASTNYQPVSGMNTFTLPTPFFWNGTSNIIIEICNGDVNSAASVTFTSNAIVPVTNLSFNGSHNYRSDNVGNACGTAVTTNTGNQQQRPNIVFTWTPAGTPPPTITGTTTYCSGTTLTLNASTTVA